MAPTKMTTFLIFILAFTFSGVLVPAHAADVFFPETDSTVLPDPSLFFTSTLLQTPLPTNSFFQNFVLNNGDQPAYFHPYLFRSSNSSLTLSYPTRVSSSSSILQNFTSDLTVSAAHNNPQERHVVSAFSDLGVTLDYPSSNLRFFLVRGSPYLTCDVTKPTELSISTTHAIAKLTSNANRNKYTIKLNNSQTWLLYSSSPVHFTNKNPSLMTSGSFSGVVRVALMPESSVEEVLDKYSSSYPVNGEAFLNDEPFTMEYHWQKAGDGELLMLAHPLHLQLLSLKDRNVAVLDDFKYRSIDGDLVGVVGDSWLMKTNPFQVTWHSINGIKDAASRNEIGVALSQDVQALVSTPISTTASYFYGKLIAKAARLAMIADEVGVSVVIPSLKKYLQDAIDPWLSGTFSGNGFLYESKWSGLVTKNGAVDKGADFGFGIYNDHHYHVGYFLYAISVLAKIDQAWGSKYKDQAYSLAVDFMNLKRETKSNSARLRNFDLYNLHSWAGGLTEFADGCNQESTSEAVNAYYSVALMGLAYGDTNLTATGSLLAALEIQAAQKWWHVHQGDNMYDDVFSSANKITGVVWSVKRDTALWFAPAEAKEIRLGIQVIPILPITEVLFSNVSYVKELVDWTAPALNREGATDAWRGFAYSLEGIYNKQDALQKIRNLAGFDDGNSLTNLLWWIHSRG